MNNRDSVLMYKNLNLHSSRERSTKFCRGEANRKDAHARYPEHEGRVRRVLSRQSPRIYDRTRCAKVRAEEVTFSLVEAKRKYDGPSFCQGLHDGIQIKLLICIESVISTYNRARMTRGDR